MRLLRKLARGACLAIIACAGIPAHGEAIPIVVNAEAPSAMRIAADELAAALAKIYPVETFAMTDRLPETGRCIRIIDRSLGGGGGAPAPTEPRPSAESYKVHVANDGPRQVLAVSGADARGAVYGVYALLEHLGAGFYLSYDALPAPRRGPMPFDLPDFADAPLVRDRIVFNWHNFLSGCSTWDLRDWDRWTAQAQKMGFNAIMVHAYGNNPMVRFSFEGADKPLGYLSTTQRGRDWSTNHVNDVRRLFGGFVFDGPVFGAQAAQGCEDQRGPAAEALMKQVFQYAERRGMGIVFANDVDTISANPQELILKLPTSARFPVSKGGVWLANPDTPAGDEFYRSQARALLSTYPQITQLVVWFRQDRTPWMGLTVDELPGSWQAEYRAAIERQPEAGKFWKSAPIFAISKIVAAYDRALRELNRSNVELCTGTWNFELLPAADLFMPAKVKLYALDYNVLHGKSQLGADEGRQFVRRVAAHRPVVPITWAHHDDGAYAGRPFTPFEQFHAKLADCGASGFGIIHWTTRPLDLYFASLGKQVWQRTEDQSLRATCEEMAVRSFGPAAGTAGGEYLYRWVTEAPIFGRETSDHLIDRPLTNIEQTVAGCEERLKLLDRVDPALLTAEQKDRVAFQRGMERFILEFHRAHDALQQADAAIQRGDLHAARAAIGSCDAGGVIERYARSASLGGGGGGGGGITRGEQGWMVSLNTRWLAHILACRQSLRMEPVRYAFGATSHDPLAQSPGWMTYFLDADHRTWQVMGEQETGAKAFTLAAAVTLELTTGTPTGDAEILRSGIEVEKPVALDLGPIFSTDGHRSRTPRHLATGKYAVTLLLLDPISTAPPRQRVLEVDLATSAARGGGRERPGVHDRIEIADRATGPCRVTSRRYLLNVTAPAAVRLTLTPLEGAAVLSAVVVEPVDH